MSGIKNSWKYEKDLLIIFNIKFSFITIRKQGDFSLVTRVVYKTLLRVGIVFINIIYSNNGVEYGNFKNKGGITIFFALNNISFAARCNAVS